MHLEILIPTRKSPYTGDVHYRIAGEQHPLCGQVRTNWCIVTLREWVNKYVKNNFCMGCVEQKHRVDHRTRA